MLYFIQESLQDAFLERLVLMVLICMFVKILQLYTFCLPLLLMALSCNMDISGLLSSSCSANISAIWGSPTELHERASGAWFVVPLHHPTVQLKIMSLVWRHWSLGFLISSNQCLFRIEINGLWSVMILQCCSPTRNILHFMTARTTASISGSIIAI